MKFPSGAAALQNFSATLTCLGMASLNPPIVDDLSQRAIPRYAVIVGSFGGGREVLLARRSGMHLDVSGLIAWE